MIILMPIWPMLFRKILFYVSLYILIAYFSVLIIRTTIYLIFRGLGISFWILPEMLNDKLFPLFSFEYNKELHVCEIIVRILLVCFVVFVGFRFYKEPETIGKLLYKKKLYFL